MPTTAAGAATDRQRVAAARRRSRPLTEARIASIDTKRGREMQTTKDPFSHGSMRAKAGAAVSLDKAAPQVQGASTCLCLFPGSTRASGIRFPQSLLFNYEKRQRKPFSVVHGNTEQIYVE